MIKIKGLEAPALLGLPGCCLPADLTSPQDFLQASNPLVKPGSMRATGGAGTCNPLLKLLE